MSISRVHRGKTKSTDRSAAFLPSKYRVGRVELAVHGSGDNARSKVNEKWELISDRVGRNRELTTQNETFLFFV